ncbi:MAG: class I SAM-dependent methyltransferase [Methanobacterium sp.]|nr:class I SAM-dependent methyltransferase [Methanobacterium sp.]
MIISEKIWDLMANNYDKSEEPFRKIHITNLKKTKKYLNKGDTVLDLGCGTGTQALEIAGDVKEVHGIDISSKMIEIAKRKAQYLKTPNVYFTQTTIFDERIKRGSFDVILAFNVLHYLEDTQEVMQRINELLKPGGLFISSTECMGEEEKKKFSRFLSFSALFVMKKARIISTKFFKFSELEDLTYNSNFQIVETEKLKLRDLRFYFIVAKISLKEN